MEAAPGPLRSVGEWEGVPARAGEESATRVQEEPHGGGFPPEFCFS